MDKELRSKCQVEIVPVIFVRFQGVKDPENTMRLPEDDDVVSEFLRYSLDEKLFPIRSGGASGRGIYAYPHPIDQKEKIKEFFTKAGVEVIEYEG